MDELVESVSIRAQIYVYVYIQVLAAYETQAI